MVHARTNFIERCLGIVVVAVEVIYGLCDLVTA
jgi:hypothetical protein